MSLSIEFWDWEDIPADRKHEAFNGDREVLSETFLGEPIWVPWMHR